MNPDPRTAPSTRDGLVDDPSIPVLTERIFLSAEERKTTRPASTPPESQPPDESARATASIADEAAADDEGHGESIAMAVEAAVADVPDGHDADSGLDRAAGPVAETEAGPAAPDVEATRLHRAGEVAAADVSATVPGPGAEASAPAAETFMPSGPPIVAAEPGEQRESLRDAAGAGEAAIALPTATAARAGAASDGGAIATSADIDRMLASQAEALRIVVLQRVAERLPGQIHAAVRDLMQPAIERAMARLAEEAEVALRVALHDLVERALREELARHGDAGERR